MRRTSRCIQNRPEDETRYETTKRCRAEWRRTVQVKRSYRPWSRMLPPLQTTWTLFLKSPVRLSMSPLSRLWDKRFGKARKTFRSAWVFESVETCLQFAGAADATARVEPTVVATTAIQRESFQRFFIAYDLSAIRNGGLRARCKRTARQVENSLSGLCDWPTEDSWK
jgi:hypothetical protein